MGDATTADGNVTRRRSLTPGRMRILALALADIRVQEIFRRGLGLARGAPGKPRVRRKEPRRLVDHDDVAVFVQYLEREKLRLHIAASMFPIRSTACLILSSEVA